MTNLERLMTPPSQILERWTREARSAGLDVGELEDLTAAVRELEEAYAQGKTADAELESVIDYGVRAMADEDSDRFGAGTALEVLQFFVRKVEEAAAAKRKMITALETLIQSTSAEDKETSGYSK